MQPERRGPSEPSHVCLTQSVMLSRCRHLGDGVVLAVRHIPSTFLRPFARRALPRFFAHMDALTHMRPALRILIRDNELRPCIHPGLLALCIKPSDRSASNHLLPPSGPGLGLARSLPRDTVRHRSHPSRSLGVLWASPSLEGWPRQPAESSSSLSYGPAVHLQLLSTPSHEDAVTFGYKAQIQLRRGLPPR